MICRCVIEYHVHHQSDAALIASGDQVIHIFHGAKFRIDPVIISNIIAIVVHR